jgi:DNA polymerase III epsilon subunit-like protein
MFLLFLDTETTGVDFASDQIIELGAVMFELDPISLIFSPVDKFESTVALRQKLDDKISRITGITTEELSTAQSLTKVQQKWNDWLDKYESNVEAIIGHSVDFDLHFLTKEGWFLPTQKNIDTLNLSKILFPNLSAVNQEFLSKKLGFEQKIPFTDLVNLTHHRSLYDSIMCANLFGVILKEITALNCSPEFIDYFGKNFMDLGLQFYKKTIDQNIIENVGSVRTKPKINHLSISDKNKEESQIEKINILDYSSLRRIDNLFEFNLSSSLRLVLAQVYVLNLKSIESVSNLKFHAQGGNFWSYNFFNLIISYISSQSDNANTKTEITKYESIIDQLSQVLDHSVNLGQITEYLEILNQILIANDITSKEIQSVLSQYDFLLFTAQPLLQNSELKLALTSPNYHQRNFVTKLENLVNNLSTLELEFKIENEELKDLLNFIRSQIKSQISMIYFDNNAFYSFRISGKYLSMTRAKKNFDINAHFVTLLDSKPLIQTFLTEQGFAKLNKLASLNFGQSQYELNPAAFDYEFEKLNNFDGLEYLQSKLENAKAQKKIVIIMCGLNSSMNNIQKLILQDDALTRNSLIVGESGSLTKIASKIEQGFTGLVIVKFSSLGYFVNESSKRSDIAEVVIYDKPYFNIHSYWYNLAKQSNDEKVFLDKLKELHLQAKVNFIHQQTGGKVEFVWNLG